MAPYTLYHFQFSLFSIMVRYTLALGEGSQGHKMEIDQKIVNLHKDEHLSEWYLCDINPKGQVPAMTSTELAEPITESLDISRKIAEYYPSVLPEDRKEVILRLLEELGTIQPLSLSAAPLDPEDQDKGIENASIEVLLSRNDISLEWRKALEFKRTFFNSTLRYALNIDAVERAKKQAVQFFEHLQDDITEQPGWIFGGPSGTIIDAYCVPFIARLMEAGNGDLVPQRVQDYAQWAMARNEWQSVMEGKPTLWDVYLRDYLIPLSREGKA